MECPRRDRLAFDGGHDAKHRRRQALEGDLQATPAGPPTGRRGDGDFVDDVGLDFFQAKARRVQLIDRVGRDELEERAMVGEQAEPAIPGVFDRHGGLGANALFEQEGARAGQLAKSVDRKRRPWAGVEDGG